MSAQFRETREDGLLVIECPETLNEGASRELQASAKRLLDGADGPVVLDLRHTRVISPAFNRVIMLIHQALKKRGRALFGVNASVMLAKQIKDAGLDGVYRLRPGVAAVRDELGIRSRRPGIDVEFLNPFLGSAKSTLETQANTPVTAGKPRLKSAGAVPPCDIAGVISLQSAVFQGSIALCFPKDVFLGIYGNMVGETHDTITPEIEDAAGELLNIIFGLAKAVLSRRDAKYQIQKAIPTVVRGRDLQVHHLTNSVAMILPFETSFGPFHIEISIDMEAERAAA